jgi:hypothetical protein
MNLVPHQQDRRESLDKTSGGTGMIPTRSQDSPESHAFPWRTSWQKALAVTQNVAASHRADIQCQPTERLAFSKAKGPNLPNCDNAYDRSHSPSKNRSV